MLYFFCFVFLIMKGTCDGVTFICIYGRDVQGNGKLFESALRRIHIGLMFSHIVLLIQCYHKKDNRAVIVNGFILALCFFVQLMLKKWGIADFKSIINMVNHLDYSTPNVNDKADWVYAYTHPFIKKTPFIQDFIARFNSPLEAIPHELRTPGAEARRKFEMNINKPKSTESKRKSLILQRGAYSVYERRNDFDINKIFDPAEERIFKLPSPKTLVNNDTSSSSHFIQRTLGKPFSPNHNSNLLTHENVNHWLKPHPHETLPSSSRYVNIEIYDHPKSDRFDPI